jgi:hypothetical protein
VITGAEAGTVVKAGTSIVQGIKTALAKSEAKWPNTREALMELFAILDEWCESAEETNEAAQQALRDAEHPPILGAPMIPGYVENATRDIKGVLNPSVPWLMRWRRSASRAAARRTLRSMMRIYCPDLLRSFEQAVANRSAWVTENRSRWLSQSGTPSVQKEPISLEELVAALPIADPQKSTEKLQELRTTASQLESTLRDLQAARDDLRILIQKNYPVLAG